VSDIENIHSKLVESCRLLDKAASEIVFSSLPYPSADVESIGKALSHILDVQQSIYSVSPELTPAHLLEKSRHPNENKEFGKLLVQNERLLAQNKPEEAILLVREFIGSDPASQFVEMAESEIERIKSVFKLSGNG
jgi:hypothetical protein